MSTLIAARRGWVTSNVVNGSSLSGSSSWAVTLPILQLPATLLVSSCLSACRTDRILQLGIMLRKTTQKAMACFFPGRDDESASASVPLPSPRLYQSAVFRVSVASACRTAWKQKSDYVWRMFMWTILCWLPWRVPSSRVPKLVLSLVGFVQNSAVSATGRSSTRQVQDCSFFFF